MLKANGNFHYNDKRVIWHGNPTGTNSGRTPLRSDFILVNNGSEVDIIHSAAVERLEDGNLTSIGRYKNLEDCAFIFDSKGGLQWRKI